MTDPALIRVDAVRKKFCRDLKRSLSYGLRDVVRDLLRVGPARGAQLRAGEFWAVEDVSFELRRGECAGLIGRNGAGKTTLLRLLNGLIKPDGGRIEIRGRVGALIALGAGFNPILTGRENLIVNGAILGFSRREVEARMEEIVDFSEIGDALEAPVGTYSSGMQARLGFASASSFDCEILLIDEVLAVGDFAFRQKCFRRLARFVENGGSALLVSHAIEQILARTQRVLVMESGRLIFDGAVREGAALYEQRTLARTMAAASVNEWESRTGESAVPGSPVRLTAASFQAGPAGLPFSLEVSMRAGEAAEKLWVIVSIFAELEVVAVQTSLEFSSAGTGVERLVCEFPALPLRPGLYPVQIRLHDRSHACLDVLDRTEFLLELKPGEAGIGTPSLLQVETRWNHRHEP